MPQFVTLVNRTSKTLKGVWDGRHYDITPGKHSFPEIQAMKFKDQNPILGTRNPFTMINDCLLGIEEQGDDCSPIEQSEAIELIDRSKLGASEQKFTVIQGNGMFSRHVDGTSPLPVENGFQKP
jgi:hypothetical protein